MQAFPSDITQVLIKTKPHDRTIRIPQNELFRVHRIFQDQEYAVPPQYMPASRITVIDVGANVGLFAIFMKTIKPDSVIHCFEPAPQTFKLLSANTEGLPEIHLHPFGLFEKKGVYKMMLHPFNSGENSIAITPQEYAACVEVQIADAAAALADIGLDYIDILKIDTEGCEVPILQSLKPRLDYVGMVLIEYHSEQDRRAIDALLPHYKLFGASARTPDVGTLKYINERLLA